MIERLTKAALLLVAFTGPTAMAADITVTLTGQGVELTNSPVFLTLKDADLEPGVYTLKPLKGDGASIEAQVVRDGESLALAMVIPALGARETAHYTLEPSTDATEGVSITSEGRDLRVEIDGDLFTIYRAEDGPKPYFFPVIGPTGAPMTRAYPMEDVEGEDRDHPHQRSFWFTHGNVDGVDFWASDPLNRPNPKFGRITESDRLGIIDGPVVGVIETANAWNSPEGQVLCTDHRVWRTYDLDGVRVIDFDVTISAGKSSVTFEDTKEGTFGLRLASSMNVNKKTGGRIVNAEGIVDTEAWGKASPWVDYTGPIGNETLGVAILNHPSSFRYPTTWHVRDYGLFAANPFGYKDFNYADSGTHTIAPGESIELRYRVILHEGDTDQAKIAREFEAYANPPEVQLSEAK
ncbi:DUF6807 domain-containing protein [Tautonia marina]|uniref:DUF6807 domain-containing protein n=1 Tax=Tautonia marina TaxID=2653855 RepID=UPI00126124B3|nr:PmoA family protein [Tautonia marina]